MCVDPGAFRWCQALSRSQSLTTASTARTTVSASTAATSGGTKTRGTTTPTVPTVSSHSQQADYRHVSSFHHAKVRRSLNTTIFIKKKKAATVTAAAATATNSAAETTQTETADSKSKSVSNNFSNQYSNNSNYTSSKSGSTYNTVSINCRQANSGRSGSCSSSNIERALAVRRRNLSLSTNKLSEQYSCSAAALNWLISSFVLLLCITLCTSSISPPGKCFIFFFFIVTLIETETDEFK